MPYNGGAANILRINDFLLKMTSAKKKALKHINALQGLIHIHSL